MARAARIAKCGVASHFPVHGRRQAQVKQRQQRQQRCEEADESIGFDAKVVEVKRRRQHADGGRPCGVGEPREQIPAEPHAWLLVELVGVKTVTLGQLVTLSGSQILTHHLGHQLVECRAWSPAELGSSSGCIAYQ